MDYNILYLIGISLTFFVGVANIILTLRNSKKTTFINSVTASRIRYIQDIRNRISEFCGLVYSYNLTYSTSHSLAATPDKLFELQREFDKLKYLVKLHLNPEDVYWDEQILKLLDEIIDLKDKEPKEKIDELIIITQFLLKLEWEGAKLESEKGKLNELEKQELYRKHEELHKQFVKNKVKNDKSYIV